MAIDPREQPRVKVKLITLIESIYRFHGAFQASELAGEYSISLVLGINNEKKTQSYVTLGATATNKLKPKIAEISVKVLGIFEGSEEDLKIFAPNSATILFPYLRSYMAIVTGWGPSNEILLPLMNVTKQGLDALNAKKEELETPNP